MKQEKDFHEATSPGQMTAEG